MYKYDSSIELGDTDATGVIYYPQQLRIASKALESFLRPTPYSFRGIIDSIYLMPVVHAESDYISALHVDDEIQVQMYLERIGTSSFSLSFDFYNKTTQILAGTAKITHVLTLKETKKSIPLTEELKEILSLLKSPSVAT
jgi:YbgC/YbaW family acyl-CoA thioester hydrolase